MGLGGLERFQAPWVGFVDLCNFIYFYGAALRLGDLKVCMLSNLQEHLFSLIRFVIKFVLL